jgi:hypothetical protein
MGGNLNHTGVTIPDCGWIEKLYWELVTIAREEIRDESIPISTE